MQSYPYLLVNVFATSHFGGNPLAVFYEADGLTDLQMQLIARQFNLSEVVFIQSSTDSQAVKKLKIFTPDYEMRSPATQLLERLLCCIPPLIFQQPIACKLMPDW